MRKRYYRTSRIKKLISSGGEVITELKEREKEELSYIDAVCTPATYRIFVPRYFKPQKGTPNFLKGVYGTAKKHNWKYVEKSSLTSEQMEICKKNGFHVCVGKYRITSHRGAKINASKKKQ